MMIDHTNCDHPRTRAARLQCRRARGIPGHPRKNSPRVYRKRERKTYGIQPAVEIMRRAGLTPGEAADQMSLTVRSSFAGALRGLWRPSSEVCDRLPALLGVPLDKLFTPEVLAVPFNATKSHPGHGQPRSGGRAPVIDWWTT